MNHEQNIDDILRQLKDSVSQEKKEDTVLSQPSKKEKGTVLTEDALKEQLKQQYGADAESSEEQMETVYALDHELLQEITTGDTEPLEAGETESPLVESSVAAEDEEPFKADWKVESKEADEIWEPVQIWEQAEPVEQTEDAVDGIRQEENVGDEAFDVENPQWEEAVQELLALEQDETELTEELSDTTASDKAVEEIEEPIYAELTASDLKEMEAEESVISDEEEEPSDFPEIQAIDLTDLLTDYETEEPLLEESSLPESVQVSAEHNVHESVLELMQQLGCSEELETVAEEEVPEELVQEEYCESDPTEYHSHTQDESIASEYRKAGIKVWLQVGLLGILTLIAFFYDTLPTWNIAFSGITDYDAYPGAYIFIGLQPVFLAIACLWKHLWQGVKRIFSLRPDSYSMLVMLILMLTVYDVGMVFAAPEALPPMFHFLCLLLMLLVHLSTALTCHRESKLFRMYSSDQIQFTLKTESGKNSVAEKMYCGGFDPNKKICSPDTVEFPIGFFRSVRADAENQNRMLAIFFLPLLLLSILAAIIETVLHQSVLSMLLIALAVWIASFPLNTALFDSVGLWLSSVRLGKRGIALTSKDAIRELGETDVLVCQDLHLFRKCRTEDTGIVFYDTAQTVPVLAGLQILYVQIGGPLAGVFENVPQTCRFESVRIRRIARNGIEAILDEKHVLLVGSAEFMQRYGFQFPKGEEKNGRVTLCVSLDGKQSAKINAAYEPIPIFEMLVERLKQNGVQCVIETYDPLINTALITALRTVGAAPISVVHKNAMDLREGQKPKRKEYNDTGMLVLSSRLKLAEAIVWSRRILKAIRYRGILSVAVTLLGMIGLGICVGAQGVSALNQHIFLAFVGSFYAILLLLYASLFPHKKYFTVEKLEKELLAQQQKAENKLQKQTQKLRKKTKNKKEQKNHE